FLDPPGSRLQHLDDAAAVEPLATLGDVDQHPLLRQAAGGEDHLAVEPSHDDAAMGDPFEPHLVHRRTLASETLLVWSLRRPELRSWYGTEVTMTLCMKCSRVRMSSAVSLWSSCSHQCPTTYSGM